MAQGRRRAAAAGVVMDALLRVPPLPVPMSVSQIERLFAMRRFAARLRLRHARVRGFDIPYLEGGEGPPIVLVHGFSDNKDSFVDTARLLTRHRRVILPDLLGFGDASQPFDFEYRLASLAGIVGEFAQGLGLRKYDLGGNSLGGAVAATLALQRPESIRSLILVASAGVRMPRPSPLQTQLDAGENPFVLTTFEEYRQWVRVVLEVPPSIPVAVQRHLADRFIARASLNAKIMEDLLGSGEDLREQLPQLEAPTLLVWGNQDRLIDLSAGHVFHRELPDASLVIFDGVGHCPQLEAPQKTADVFRNFLTSVTRATAP